MAYAIGDSKGWTFQPPRIISGCTCGHGILILKCSRHNAMACRTILEYFSDCECPAKRTHCNESPGSE